MILIHLFFTRKRSLCWLFVFERKQIALFRYEKSFMFSRAVLHGESLRKEVCYEKNKK